MLGRSRVTHRMNRHIKTLFGLSLCAILAGCAGGVVIGTEYVNITYRPNEAALVGSGSRELRVVVEGNPFNVTDAAFDAAVIAGMLKRFCLSDYIVCVAERPNE